MRSIDIPGSDPSLLVFHGTGGDERDLIPLAQRIAPGSRIRSYRGIVEEHGMLRWFPRKGMNVFDETQVRAHVERIRADLQEEFSDDELRESVFLGYSNGANAIAAMLRIGAPITKAVLLHPMQVLSDPVDLSGVEVFVSLGETDRMIPPEESERLIGSLESAGARVRALRLPGGHGIDAREVEEAARWLQERTS